MPLHARHRLLSLLAMALAVATASSTAPWPRSALAAEPRRRVIVKLKADVPDSEARLVMGPLLSSGAASDGLQSPFKRVHARARGKTGLTRIQERFPQRARRAPKGLAAPRLDGIYVVDVPATVRVDDAISRLSKDPRVEYVQPDHAREVHWIPNDPFWSRAGSWGQPYDDLWPLKSLGLERAWDTARGAGVLVAVVDSGIEYVHPDLAANFVDLDGFFPGDDTDGNGYVDDSYGWNFVSYNSDPRDEYGHGTVLAGIIAAEGDNGFGIVGVAPRAVLMAVKAVDTRGRTSSAIVADSIVYAADKGADVMLVASGCVAPCPSDPIVEDAVRYATAAGVLVVVSAGNVGRNLALSSPQNMIEARPVVVGAVDQHGRRESFSGFGDFLDLVAPGGGTNMAPPADEPVLNILSLKPDACAALVCRPRFFVTAEDGSQYLRHAGTSLSAAYVTGVAALVLSAQPGLDLESLRVRLFGNAAESGPAGHDPMFGFGRLDGLASVADTSPFVLARLLAPASGESVSGLVRIAGTAVARSFARYQVLVGEGTAPTLWRTTGVFTAGHSTSHGDLAQWNSERVPNGPWTIRLVVHDGSGRQREARRMVTVNNGQARHHLIVELASEAAGSGHVDVTPPRALCKGAADATRSCSYSYDVGTTVTLRPVADRLSAFAGWSGACTGRGSCTVEMTRLQQVRALFRGPYELTVELRYVGRYGGSWVRVIPGAHMVGITTPLRFKPGTAVTLEPQLDDHPYIFHALQWDGCGQPCEGGGSCALVMNQDHLIDGTLLGEVFPGEPPIAWTVRDKVVELGTPVPLCGYVVGATFNQEWRDEAGELVLGHQLLLPLGSHTFTFTAFGVTDAGVEQSSDSFTVTVVEPAPSASPGRAGRK
jgi:subtilisin family serine protease